MPTDTTSTKAILEKIEKKVPKHYNPEQRIVIAYELLALAGILVDGFYAKKGQDQL